MRSAATFNNNKTAASMLTISRPENENNPDDGIRFYLDDIEIPWFTSVTVIEQREEYFMLGHRGAITTQSTVDILIRIPVERVQIKQRKTPRLGYNGTLHQRWGSSNKEE